MWTLFRARRGEARPHSHAHTHEAQHAHEEGCGHCCEHDDEDETGCQEDAGPFGFERHFFTAAERREEIDAHLAELEEYLKALEAEATAVRERLSLLRSKS